MPGEISVLGAAIEVGLAPLPPHVGKLIDHAPESFENERAGQIAVTVRTMRKVGEPISFVTVSEKHVQFLTFIGAELSNAALPLDEAEYYAERCWKAYQVRRAKSVFADAHQDIIAKPEQAQAIIAAARAALETVTSDTDNLSDRLKARFYSATVKPIEPSPRYLLAGVPICTPGNLTTISAQAKAGKSTVVGAMIASTLTPGTDCLSFTSENPHGLAVVHLDIEQCLFDHWQLIQRVLRRAKADAIPTWLRSYCLTGFSAAEVRRSIRILTEQTKEQFGGIHSILVDGIADAVLDVNDPAETSSLIMELHKLAIEFDCPILNIIHVNPGSDFKTRGHLGSQLERKSETNLRLEKDKNGVSVIWADKNRRAPIPKKTAPRFAWDDQAGMHLSVQSLKSGREDIEREELMELAQDCFRDRVSMRYADLRTTVKTRLTVSAKTAERKVTRCRQLGIIKKSVAGLYTLAT